MILVLGKARSIRVRSLGCRGPESPGWFDVSPKNSEQDMMHEQGCCCDEAANHQLPMAAAFWIIPIVSLEEWSSLMHNLVQIHCSTPSVILNMMATQCTCSLSGIYWPHWLVNPSFFTCILPVHSPWLPGYTAVQTVLVIVTMAVLFLNRPHIWNKIIIKLIFW